MFSANAMKFNEIMYDSVDSDTGNEWIELYNDENQSINLDGWKLFEGNANHILYYANGSTTINPRSYAIITSNTSRFLSNNPNFNQTLLKCTFSLSNEGETIVLKNDSVNVKDNVTYSYETGGSENGMTIGLQNKTWRESFSTPGYENEFPIVCDWMVYFDEEYIYSNPSSFNWKTYVEKYEGDKSTLTINRRIEDTFGNIVKQYSELVKNITNMNTFSVSPNLNPGAYLLIAEANPSCNDSDGSDNIAKKLIFVNGQQQTTVTNTTSVNQEEEHEKDSKLEIKKIYDLIDDKAKFGQIIRIRLNVYKGDTRKQTVTMTIEGADKISKETTLTISEKYIEQEITLPIQINPNCNEKYKDGTYEIVVQGLDEEVKKKIEVIGNLKGSCVSETKEITKKTESKTISSSSSNDKNENDPNHAETTTLNKNNFNYAKPYALSTVVFESAQRKSERLLPYFAIGLMSATILFFALPKIVI